eukprot:scaffold649341_cov51-Prasinocladus_malaysianus.AAC.1
MTTTMNNAKPADNLIQSDRSTRRSHQGGELRELAALWCIKELSNAEILSPNQCGTDDVWAVSLPLKETIFVQICLRLITNDVDPDDGVLQGCDLVYARGGDVFSCLIDGGEYNLLIQCQRSELGISNCTSTDRNGVGI